MSNLLSLIKELGWPLKDAGLYRVALTHSSYSHEKQEIIPCNERLEFLGDAVLELVISEYLYNRYPDLPEGNLTRMRAAIVCEHTLAQLARDLKLGRFVMLGKGEKASGGSTRPALLADLTESLIGALFLQAGFEQTRDLIIKLFSGQLQCLGEEKTADYKTQLQEVIQADIGVTPIYTIVSAIGPDHNKFFTARVIADGKILGTGSGYSKKEAEQAAAREALDK